MGRDGATQIIFYALPGVSPIVAYAGDPAIAAARFRQAHQIAAAGGTLRYQISIWRWDGHIATLLLLTRTLFQVITDTGYLRCRMRAGSRACRTPSHLPRRR